MPSQYGVVQGEAQQSSQESAGLCHQGVLFPLVIATFALRISMCQAHAARSTTIPPATTTATSPAATTLLFLLPSSSSYYDNKNATSTTILFTIITSTSSTFFYYYCDDCYCCYCCCYFYYYCCCYYYFYCTCFSCLSSFVALGCEREGAWWTGLGPISGLSASFQPGPFSPVVCRLASHAKYCGVPRPAGSMMR